MIFIYLISYLFKAENIFHTTYSKVHMYIFSIYFLKHQTILCIVIVFHIDCFTVCLTEERR